MQARAASLSTYCGAGQLRAEVEGGGSYATEQSSAGEKGSGSVRSTIERILMLHRDAASRSFRRNVSLRVECNDYDM